MFDTEVNGRNFSDVSFSVRTLGKERTLVLKDVVLCSLSRTHSGIERQE